MSQFASPLKNAPVQTKEAKKNGPDDTSVGAKQIAPPKFGLEAGGPIQKQGLLDENQLKSAKTYYSGKSGEFTAEVIKEIQNKVGTTATGTIDDATLEAIAKFQSDNGMDVDGKLGTKSLPKLFAHGLATDTAQQDFAKDYLGLDWSKLTTAQQRGQGMVDLINKQLKAAGVPEVTINLQDLGGDSGRFSFSNWFIRMDQAFLEKESHTQKELDDFANTVIHESRHAEQWYNMAQRLAGKGNTADQIETEMGIPAKIAKAAVADPIKDNTAKALVANGWYESVYGSGRDHRRNVLGPTGTYEEYRNLAEESDAWRVGDDFNKQLDGERKKKEEDKK